MTDGGQVDGSPMADGRKTYSITWTEISDHSVEIDEEELARIKSVTVAELREMDSDEIRDDLADDLANLDDEGFDGLTREDITVEENA